MRNDPDKINVSDLLKGVGFGALLLIVVGTLFIREPSVAPRARPLPNSAARPPAQGQAIPFPEDARMLAQVDADPGNSAPYGVLLAQLNQTFGDGEKAIVTGTLLAQSKLKESGVTQPILPLLQGMSSLFPPNTTGRKYDDYLTSYVALRKTKTHEETVAALAALIGAQANPAALAH